MDTKYIQVLVSCYIFFLTNCAKWISEVNCHIWKDFQGQIWWLETCSPIFTCPLFFSQSALAIQGAHSLIFYPPKFCHIQNYKDNFEINIYKLYTQKLVHTVKWRVQYDIYYSRALVIQTPQGKPSEKVVQIMNKKKSPLFIHLCTHTSITLFNVSTVAYNTLQQHAKHLCPTLHRFVKTIHLTGGADIL